MTLANKITTARFFIAVAYFVLLALNGRGADWRLLDPAFGLFLAAVVGDAFDGYYARKYGQVTSFGRIADPFVDKLVICGSFVFFLSIESLHELLPGWMVVVILGREFLVTAIRGAVEAQGIPFGASSWGKLKMIVQSSVVGTILVYVSHLSVWPWVYYPMNALIWLTVMITAASGVRYVLEARKLLR